MGFPLSETYSLALQRNRERASVSMPCRRRQQLPVTCKQCRAIVPHMVTEMYEDTLWKRKLSRLVRICGWRFDEINGIFLLQEDVSKREKNKPSDSPSLPPKFQTLLMWLTRCSRRAGPLSLYGISSSSSSCGVTWKERPEPRHNPEATDQRPKTIVETRLKWLQSQYTLRDDVKIHRAIMITPFDRYIELQKHVLPKHKLHSLFIMAKKISLSCLCTKPCQVQNLNEIRPPS